MRVAYIAGPYRAKTSIGKLINIWKARKAAKKYWKMGYAVICPHSNSALFDGVVDELTFLNGDLEILKRCVDVLVLLPKWEDSTGSVIEQQWAIKWGKEIHYLNEKGNYKDFQPSTEK